jgi:Protein of unknown function (DUF2510)
MYYGHGSWVAVVIFVGFFIIRYVNSQRRRGGGGQFPGYGGRRGPGGSPQGNAFTPNHPQSAAPPRAAHGSGDQPVTGSGTAPGWFTDPFFRHGQRYWSGTEWTEHVTDDGVPGIDPPGRGGPTRDDAG